SPYKFPLASPPATPHAGQTHRLTQPLNRSTSIARVSQDLSNAPQPARQQPQGYREQGTPPIPAPYTTNTVICPICKGAGYLRADVPYGHPNFGKPIACECKEAERSAKRRLQLQQLSNLGELKDKRFENFRPNVSRSVYEAYHAALKYAENPKGWLVLIGKVGCGKTHLAAAIANEALACRSRVLFSTVIDLLDHLRKAYSPTATEVYDKVLDEMREAEMLVLDDLGAQQSTPWANEKLFQLLNFRYNFQMPTVITTNNSGLQGIDERIRSRMTDNSLVNILLIEKTVDYRPQNPRRE
ncbi:MAG TPA: ATP-binding protein, partial [Ktedonobacteraceae bacterium]|nr:ATP-binding protein [Ktedonobacteraceae bacterium]